MKGADGFLAWSGWAFALCLPVAAHAQEACHPETVWLRNAAGQIQRFTIELADDPSERARGLMGREAMASGMGMLFVYQAPTHAVFWMKNTLIPLDMLFFDPSGQLQHVHAMAQPNDLKRIDGGEEVGFVLEINGGLAKSLGLGPGTQLRHPSVRIENAAWPCE